MKPEARETLWIVAGFVNEGLPEKYQKGASKLSQSKSEDSWAQEALNDSTSKTFKMTVEEIREIKKLRRSDFNDFADAYYEYLQLEKKEGSLGYTLKDFCETKGVTYRFPK